MAGEVIGLDNVLPDNTYGAVNTIWDQSAKIYASVIDNAGLLPDDREKTKGVSTYKKNHAASRFNNKAKARLKKFTLARLQEEHALWLK